jgi:hypothetical protein
LKKLVLIIMATVVICLTVDAQGAFPKAGQFGLQTDLVFTSTGFGNAGDVGAKIMITDNLALRLALGVQGSTLSLSSINTLVDLGAGLEFHFRIKGGVSPYLGVEVSTNVASFTDVDYLSYGGGICAVFGGEYFFSSNFSWAGEARVGGIYFAEPPSGAIGTLGFATFLTWYFN